MFNIALRQCSTGLCFAYFAACSYARRAGPLSISGPARVTDGGTIIINGNSIRLQGLDAEELAMTNGPKAAAVMRNITADHVITTSTDGDDEPGSTAIIRRHFAAFDRQHRRRFGCWRRLVEQVLRPPRTRAL